MDLVLITTSWPFCDVPEFLDNEIQHLAKAFDEVRVAPLRPRGPILDGLPSNVRVDLTLAELVKLRVNREGRFQRSIALFKQAVADCPGGTGFRLTDLSTDGHRLSWQRQTIVGRIYSRIVTEWAQSAQAPSIAYTFWLGPATVGLRRAWPNARLVSRVHGGDLYSEAHRWNSIPFQELAIRSCDLVASVSQHGCDYLSAKFAQHEEKIVWRRLGTADLGLASWSPDPSVLRLVSVSSIDTNKRVDLIARVCSELASVDRSVDWTHIGDGPERGHVEAVLRQGPDALTGSLLGKIAQPAVFGALLNGSHDVFINLSRSEGAPVSLMEAQSLGIPVVATRAGGTPEVVPDGLNDLVEIDSSISDICNAVLAAASRSTLERQLRRAAWQDSFSADLNYYNWAQELLQLSARKET